MKTFYLTLVLIITYIGTMAQDATEIVKKSNSMMQGESSYMEMSMKIVRPKWERTVSFKSCSLGSDYGLTLVTSPSKEAGQSFLKSKDEMWSWNPTINKTIKLGPSMLAQGWMGSDFSNDELLNEAAIVEYYSHKILATENVAGKDCYKIECTQKTGDEVIWGKQIRWISKTGDLLLKTEYYDDELYLVKTELAYDIKTIDKREIPTTYEIITTENPDNKTIVTMDNIIFNVKVDASFFSTQTMKKGLAIDFPKTTK